MLLKGGLAMICKMSYSVPTIKDTNCLRIGLALGNNFLNSTVKQLAFYIHIIENKSDFCQGNGREPSCRDLNHVVGKHRFLLATAVFALADGLLTEGFFGHKREITETPLTVVSNKRTNQVSSIFEKYHRCLAPKKY